MSDEKQEPTQEPKHEQSGSERASKMMDGMLKGLREFGHVAKEKAEEYGKIASDKAEELTKQGKLKLDVHQLNRSRSKALAELGELVFELNHEAKLKELAKNEKFLGFIKTIDELDAEIAKKEAHAEAEEAADDTDKVEVKPDKG